MYKRSSHREKKYENQIITYGILLVVVVIFLATIGLNLLIKSTLFVSDFFSRGKTDQTGSKETFLLAPELFDVPTATNSATILIHGRGTQNMKLAFFVNDNIKKEMDLDKDEFEAEVDLDKGENTFYAQLTDPKTHQNSKSETFKVTVITDKPKLEISAPQPGFTTDKNEVVVTGTTDPDSGVRINDQPTVIDSQGNFNASIKLQPGDNKITIASQDVAGNTETKEITVTYENN